MSAIRRLPATARLLIGLAVLPAHSQDVAPALGKERAAGSRIEWEIRDAGGSSLGSVRVASIRNPVETAAGDATIHSRAHVSCDRSSRRLAIELHNAIAPGDAGGLQPAAMPLLVCSRPIAPWDAKLVQEELLATWQVDPGSGAASAAGLRSFPLRECVSIRVEQEVALPPGGARKSARIEFEIHPYGRELDSIFATCGERSAYAPAPADSVVAAAAPAPKPAREAEAKWQRVRVLASGKTNVRAGPTLHSAIVAQIPPGAAVLVQSTGTDWWRAKPTRGAGFEGYIRQDRLALK